MNTKEQFNQLYDDISNQIRQTVDDISQLSVENEKGQIHLNEIREQLQALHDSFNHKLDYLKQHAEWDKFTVAFFGETNAGKSTIIESLRILFDEATRRDLLNNNQKNLQNAEQELSKNLDHLNSDLVRAYGDIVDKFRDISLSVRKLQQVVADESALRIKMEEEEKNTRLLIEQNESQSRLHILQQQTNAKVRFRLCATVLVSMIVGAAAAFLFLNQVVGGGQ
ncbi:hypothetical protein [Escherichia coli]|uniref:hypothetical protein n=1 Tax=Escherichia coli TaxID=562 RepID=UPI0020355FD4|nr:hypothetical protein [Escherichia coli]